MPRSSRHVGPHEDFLTIVKRRKLQCYGHDSRSSGLACQNHLARHSERGKKAERGRGGKTIIREWTGLEFGKSHRAVENRGKWGKLVAKSFVVLH